MTLCNVIWLLLITGKDLSADEVSELASIASVLYAKAELKSWAISNQDV